VVEDSEGPAVVVGCDDGAVYAWDLGGHDKGQIYAEMSSLSPMEVPCLEQRLCETHWKRIEMQRDPADCVVEDLRLHCISPAGKILVCSMLFPLF
jgi:hypothetical protein